MHKINSKEIEKQQKQVLNIIRAKRVQQGLSQEAMAYAIGISTNAYHAIETGKTQLSTYHIFAIAQVLQCNPCVLFLFTASSLDATEPKICPFYI